MEYMQGLLRFQKLNFRINNYLGALPVLSFMTLLLNPSRKKIVLKMMIIVEKRQLMALTPQSLPIALPSVPPMLPPAS